MAKLKSKWFETPSSGFGYATKFYYKVFKSISQDETLSLNSELPPMKTTWFLTEKKMAAWLKLTGYDLPYPQAFTFSAPAGVWALMQVLKEIGISFGRIMHLSSRLLMLSKDGFQVGEHYSTYVHYLGVKPHSKRAVMIRFLSIVKNVRGQDIMHLEDELYVAGLDEDFVKQLNLSSEETQRRNTKATLLNNKMADSLKIDIGRSLGQQYGKLSGDLNPMHISSIGARLFGHKKSFIQGLCTLNVVVATLGKHWKCTIRSMDINFIRPVSQPSKPTLLCTLDHFELVDDEGNLLVSGRYICSN
ncbi:hypothetical protein KO489_11675 [Reinekea forsetii]|nr:hypothetical protein [Reinekea forsetii]